MVLNTFVLYMAGESIILYRKYYFMQNVLCYTEDINLYRRYYLIGGIILFRGYYFIQGQ